MKIPGIERLFLIVGLAAAAVLGVSGCSSGGSGGKEPYELRVLNVSAGYSSIDLYANKNYSANANEADQLRIGATNYETMSSYVTLDADNYNIKFKQIGRAHV